jgi:isopenicillin-N N-acyltransferase-like protein
MRTFQLIDVAAAGPYEGGVQYGRLAEEKIRAGVNDYRALFAETGGMSWERIKETALSYMPVVEDAYPELAEEARGIADGAGLGLDEVMVLNCRYEITKFPRPNECTSFAVLPEVGEGGRTYIGQNWDYRAGILDNVVILRMREPGGAWIIGLAEAGQVMRNGFNSGGVGLCANNLQSVDDSRGVGVPVTFLRRKALSCRSFDEAAKLLREAKRSVSCNFMLASADGRALDFEAHPGGVDVLEPVDGILTHANHFVRYPERNALETSPRGDRLRELLEKRRGRIDVSYIEQCLGDHENYPKALCRHPSDVSMPLGRRGITVAGVVYDFGNGVAHICAGPPCEGEFVAVEAPGDTGFSK